MAQLMFALGTFVILGFVWFYIARPALEGLGLIVNSSEDSAPVVMSRSAQDEPVRQRFEPAEPIAVRGDTHQAELAELSVREPEREPSRLYRLSRREEIVILATQRNDDGSYRHSANAITSFMGGTAADVKDIIREVREGPIDTKPAPPAHGIRRPASGWN